MVTTVTQLDIANMALSLLGQEPLLSYEKDSRNGRAIRLFFEPSRVGVLEDSYWSFATKRVILAPELAAPAFGWTYQFILPDDFLKEQFVLDGDCGILYRIESGKLLTNSAQPRLVYTWNQTDYSRYSAKFIELMAYKLAAKCAYQATNSRSEEQALFSAYSELLIETMSNDSIGNGEERVIQDSAWLANT